MSSKKKTPAKSKKPETKPEAAASVSLTVEQLDITYWRTIATALITDPESKAEIDQWEVGKVATALYLQTQLLARNYKDLSRIARREDGKVSVSWAWKIDGAAMPPTIKVNGSFSEKHNMKAEQDVLSNDEPLLPGLDDTTTVAPPTPPEDDEPPRVRSTEEAE